MSTTTTRRPAPAPPRKHSVMPYVFLGIAVASVLASALMWKHQHDNPPQHGVRVIATSGNASTTLAIQEVHAPEIWHCTPGSDNHVILSWAVTGATTVEVYVGGASTPLVQERSLQSQTSVPAPCAPGSQTYVVKARAADGRTVSKSATTKGV